MYFSKIGIDGQALVRLGALDENLGEYQRARSSIKASGQLLAKLSALIENAIQVDEHPNRMHTIFLRDLNDNLINYNPEDTSVFRDSLLEINLALQGKFIDIYVTNEEFTNAVRHGDNDLPLIPKVQRKYLRRSFKPNFESGGRISGGWWQLVHSEWRRFITIHNELTIECDYNCMVAEILYAKYGGNRPDGDLYSIEGIISPKARSVIKLAFQILLNTDSRRSAVAAVVGLKDLDEIGVSASDLVRMMEVKHESVVQYFYEDIGRSLQKTESDIAEKVMLRAIRDLGTVILPIHDSFIIAHRYYEWLQQTMVEVFEEITGSRCGAGFELEAPYNPFSIPDTPEERQLRSRYYDNKYKYEMNTYGELDPLDSSPNNDYS
ncbi:MAG: hypothetical protein JKY88_04135 [Pseudomonadales bacterium]|nr:hypothetical protein [Pseudomonadales bacterium]